MLLNVVDNVIIRKIKEISAVQKASFLSAIIWGFVTHLAVFSAGLMYHDGVNYSGLGATYTSGRWMLGIINDIGSKCLGIYQLPYINGFFTILMIALSSLLITKMLKVRSFTVSILIGAILVSFPSVASLFAFMFTAAAYSFGFILSVFSIFIVDKKQSAGHIAVGTVMMSISLGVYQASITFAASLALIVIICDLLRGDNAEIKQLVRKGICFVATLAFGLALYLFINKMFVMLKGIELTSYQNIDKMGVFTFEDIKKSLLYAYSDQLKVQWLGIISSYFMKNVTLAVEVLTVLLFVLYACSKRKNKKSCILASILFIMLPLALNSIYLICPGNYAGVHSLMRYSLAFTYIFPLLLIEQLTYNADGIKPVKALTCISLIIISLVPICYTYRDNTAYLNSELSQKEAVLYFNSLVTRIRATEGYSEELPVAYIGNEIEDSNFAVLPTSGNIYTYVLHFSGPELISNPTWKEFCALHLGWKPREATNTAKLSESEEVISMPCYPDCGSIRVIDGTVVVKFS